MKIEKIQKLVGNLHDKIEYIMHIRNLKQAKKNHELILKNCIKLLNLIKKSWLRPYIDVNTELTKGKKWFWERNFTNSWATQFLERVRKHKDTRLVRIEARKNYSASEPNNYKIIFLEYLLAIEMKKT